MRVLVVCGNRDNDVVCLEVDPHYTVRKLKLMLSNTKEIGIPTYNQLLQYDGNPVGSIRPVLSFPPEDDMFLCYYGIIMDESVIVLHECQCGGSFTEIYVEVVVGRIVDITSLRVSLADPVYSVKRLIDEKTGVTPDHQLLSFQGIQLENRCSLTDYGITAYSTLDLRIAEEN